MEIQRKLEDVAIHIEQGWHATAEQLLDTKDGFDRGLKIQGLGLIEAVMDRGLTAKDLRLGMHWINAYNGYAARLIGDIQDDSVHRADRVAVLAGRLAQRAGRDALDCVGSERKRERFRSIGWRKRTPDFQEALLGIDGFDIARIGISKVK